MEIATKTPPCFLVSLPTETIRDIIFFLARKHQIPLSQTCRRLKNILELKLYRHLSYKVHDGPCLLSLRELVFTEYASQVLSLAVSSQHGQAFELSSQKNLSSVLAACISRLPELRDLRIPLQLLDNLLLNNVIQSNVHRLRFTGSWASSSSSLNLDGSLLPRQPPGQTLRLSSLSIPVPLSLETSWVNQSLPFLSRVGLKPSFVKLLVTAGLGDRPDLLLQRDVGITSLTLSTLPELVTPLFPWILRVVTSPLHPELRSVTFEVRAQLVGFQLDETTWFARPQLLCMAPSTPVNDFLDQWGMVELHGYDVESRTGACRSINLRLASEQTLRPPQLLALAHHLPSLTDLTITAYYVSWTDWPSTVIAFSSLPSLGILILTCSLTPLPTLTNAITCSTCIDTFSTTHPHLNRDLQLLGGSVALWNLPCQINVARLELLADHLSKDASVDWAVSRYDPITKAFASVVLYVASVCEQDDGSKKVVRTPGMGGWRYGPGETKEFPCWNCLGWEEPDPIAKLMMCSVEEVRAALGMEGFDLATFDASPLSADAGPDSLEVFLRS